MKITKNLLLKSLFTFFIVCSVGLLITQVAFAAVADVKSVGSVTFVTGDAYITHIDKTTAPAVKNAALIAGDTIETKNGRLQLALMDGGKVSLQPNTIYKINKYEFSGKEDGSEYAFTELLKGGMRTISGLIGHKNRERYQLKTAVATIGIRGTEFTVNFNDNQLLMTTNHGSVDVCNAAGCLNAITGQSIAVSGAGAAPKPSGKAAKAAVAPPPASSKAVFSAGENVNLPSLVVANINMGNFPSAAAPSLILANASVINPVTGIAGLTGTYTVGASNGVQVGSSTTPTLINGSNATTLGAANAANGILTINFGTYLVNYNINVPTTSNGTFNLAGNGSLLAAGTFAATGTVSHSGTGNPCNSSGGGGCSGALAGGNLIQGALSGATAQQVDLQYGFNAAGNGNGNGGGAIYGGIILK